MDRAQTGGMRRIRKRSGGSFSRRLILRSFQVRRIRKQRGALFSRRTKVIECRIRWTMQGEGGPEFGPGGRIQPRTRTVASGKAAVMASGVRAGPPKAANRPGDGLRQDRAAPSSARPRPRSECPGHMRRIRKRSGGSFPRQLGCAVRSSPRARTWHPHYRQSVRRENSPPDCFLILLTPEPRAPLPG
jgi:hypothetical protein